MEIYTLYVCGLPNGYGLFNVQQLIEAFLKDPDGLRSIDFLPNSGFPSNESAVEIHLRTQQCMSR